MTKHFVVYIKYFYATNRAVVIREDANGQREILTKNGQWKEWSPSVEMLDANVEITDVHRLGPGGGPPD